MTSRKIPGRTDKPPLRKFYAELKTLSARRCWRALDQEGHYCFEYTNPAAGQAEPRRFELVQALFFQRFGNDGRGLLDMDMAVILDYPKNLAILTSAAACWDQLPPRGVPRPLAGKTQVSARAVAPRPAAEAGKSPARLAPGIL